MACTNKITKYYNMKWFYGCIATCLDPRFNMAYFRSSLQWNEEAVKVEFLAFMRKVWKLEFKPNANESNSEMDANENNNQQRKRKRNDCFDSMFTDAVVNADDDNINCQRCAEISGF